MKALYPGDILYFLIFPVVCNSEVDLMCIWGKSKDFCISTFGFSGPYMYTT